MSDEPTMIDRVAQALHATYAKQEADWTVFARAAIEAMREPTKEMIDPGYTAMDENVDFYNYDSGAGYSIEPSGPANVWRAMIDAALNDHAS